MTNYDTHSIVFNRLGGQQHPLALNVLLKEFTEVIHGSIIKLTETPSEDLFIYPSIPLPLNLALTAAEANILLKEIFMTHFEDSIYKLQNICFKDGDHGIEAIAIIPNEEMFAPVLSELFMVLSNITFQEETIRIELPLSFENEDALDYLRNDAFVKLFIENPLDVLTFDHYSTTGLPNGPPVAVINVEAFKAA